MTCFSTRNVSNGDVPVPRSAVWEVLTDPQCLTEMTPLLDGITVDGDRWCWQLSGIRALGIEVAPSFTEQMTFDEPSRITYRHAPPAGQTERAGADGVYELTEVGPDRTHLSIDITLHVDLPLPALSRRAVERVMAASIARTGEVFAERLYRHLGVATVGDGMQSTTHKVRVSA
ncbi:MAG TPA: SRPBCC family protein [Acidimicrobiales bacterium]|nr:SRPBCC family protein [Acidimicrobiales bacterium]